MDRFVFTLLLAVGVLLLVQVPSGYAWPESCGTNKSHNFYFGTKSLQDKLLYRTVEMKDRSFLRKLSYDLLVPPKGHTLTEEITYIEVLDQYTDEIGGCAYLNGGGVGNKYVNLHLKSQRNQGIHFLINVYGV